jgi:predicted nucleic acid-binding protein
MSEDQMRSETNNGIVCLVDIDIVIDFLRGRSYARDLLDDWASNGLLAVSTLTQLEVYQGMKPGEEEGTSAFLDGLRSIPVDVKIARSAGILLAYLRKNGKTIGIADGVIASTAMALRVPLLTNNVEHYPVTGLGLIRGVTSSL